MSKIIIIHPGSLYLRIGKANDLNPEMILNCVARRRKPKGEIHKDSILPTKIEADIAERISELDEARLSVSHVLQNCLKSDKRKRYGTPSNQLAAFNKRVTAEILNNQSQVNWMKPKDKVSYIVGADVLRLDPNSNFNVHFPIRRGEVSVRFTIHKGLLNVFLQFNIHSGVGGTLMSVLEDIRTIWEYAIKNYLEINLRDLHQFKAVLIIPDIYNRKRVRELTALIFKMGFSACILSEYNNTRHATHWLLIFSYSSRTCRCNVRLRTKLCLCC